MSRSRLLSRRRRTGIIVAAVAGIGARVAVGLPSHASGWEQHLVSGSASQIQAETEVLSDGNGNVDAVWMNGSPGQLVNPFYLYHNYSSNGGTSWGTAGPVESGFNNTADPSLAKDTLGNTFLGGLHKAGTSDWDVEIWKSTNSGSSFAAHSTVYSDGKFNDRDWLTVDASNDLDMVYSPRHYLTGPGTYDRPIYFTHSTDHGSTWSTPVLVNGTRGSGEGGGLAMRVRTTTDGRIVVGERAIPYQNTGEANVQANGYTYISSNGGSSWAPIQFTTSTTQIADQSNSNFLKTHPTVAVSGNTVYAAWVGTNGTSNSVYVARLDSGTSSFTTPVAVATGSAGTLSHVAMATDVNGGIRLLWFQSGTGGTWAPQYSASTDSGATWTSPVQISTFTWTPSGGWDGDFNDAVTDGHDLFYSWAVDSGSNAGVYVSILRNIT